MSQVRAHAVRESGGDVGVIGIRREDKNKWERRVPLTPEHVAALVKDGIRVLIQPCSRRCFGNAEYEAAGAELTEDLSRASTILAVKEVPAELLIQGRTYCFFSHTIKAQPANMPLLDAMLQKRVRMIDYECITKTGIRGGPRLVMFGRFAGIAGAIDLLRGGGERFLALGFQTPFLHVGAAFMYPSLSEAYRALDDVGAMIRSNGLPAPLCPFTVVFTGSGKVSQGAQEVFQRLPHRYVSVQELQRLHEVGNSSNREIYLCEVTAENMVRRRGGGPYCREEYYAAPDKYEACFKEEILPYCTVLLNCMYWDERFPKLFTGEDLRQQVERGADRLLAVGDITCDANGSVPTKKYTSVEAPYFLYDALGDAVIDGMEGPGVLFHAVDHLPCEVPREASQHFGDCLMPFVRPLATSTTCLAPFEQCDLPHELRGATLTTAGQLTPDYAYIQELREVNAQAKASKQAAPTGAGDSGIHAHGFFGQCMIALHLKGHLFDKHVINRALDVIEKGGCHARVLGFSLGQHKDEETQAVLQVQASSAADLQRVVKEVAEVVRASGATCRQAESDLPLEGFSQIKPTLAGPKRRVLILGAGFVVPPVVSYLCRRPENHLTIASLPGVGETAKLLALGSYEGQVDTTDLDLGKEVDRFESMVKEFDLVISLVPQSLHPVAAGACIKHKKHMVTASYVSPQMAELDQAAKDAKVLILNEMGVDPGIDHMSALAMIAAAEKDGGKPIGFSSICGGLPAPEAATNPLGYKFSWSPRGVLTAVKNDARMRIDGRTIKVPGSKLLRAAKPLDLNPAFSLEVLPNRDSLIYADLYSIPEVRTMFRGTLRYRGFSHLMSALVDAGLVDETPADLGSPRPSCKEWTTKLIGSKLDDRPDAKDFLEWVGLLSDAPLPGPATTSPIDVLTHMLQEHPQMLYGEGERDMLLMHHELLVEHPNGTRERRSATMIEYGNSEASAMARTVGLPTAMGAQLILDQRLGGMTGVQRPLVPEVYTPVLELLKEEKIQLREQVEPATSPVVRSCAAPAASSRASRL